MLPGFFDITPVDLGQLGPEPAVDVLREMILAEAGNLGIPISEIDVPYSTTTPDGGVDAIVRATPARTGNGLIFAPRTSYQVKAGDFALNSTSPGRIEELMLRPSSIQRRIGNEGGTLRKILYGGGDQSTRFRLFRKRWYICDTSLR